MLLKKTQGKGKIKRICKRGWGSRLGFGRRQPRGSFRAFAAVVTQLKGSGGKWLLGWQAGWRGVVSLVQIHELRGFRAILRGGGGQQVCSRGGKCPLPIVTDTMVEEPEDMGMGLGGSARSSLPGERAATWLL